MGLAGKKIGWRREEGLGWWRKEKGESVFVFDENKGLFIFLDFYK